MRLFGPTRIDFFVKRHLRSLGDLTGRTAVDVPAGAGLMSRVLREQGGTVESYDLFPELFDVEGMTCSRADLSERLPISDAHADLVLCQEAIEHVPDQLGMLRELSRILKPGGRLILSTPNVSNLRARLSGFLLESELFNRLPPNELDAVWLAAEDRDDVYFGHLFLIGAQRLRVLARIAGFRIARVLPTKWSAMSVILGVTWPLIALASVSAGWRTLRRTDADPARKRAIFREMIALNLNPQVLFGKKLFLELVKDADPHEVAQGFRENRDHVAEHIERQKQLEAEDRQREARLAEGGEAPVAARGKEDRRAGSTPDR